MRGKEYVIEIGFNDRIGLGYEVFSLLKKKMINLVGMEAIVSGKMSIKCQCESQESIDILISELKEVSGIFSISFSEFMPYEQREHQLKTILDSVSEGIIGVNHEGKITHINEKGKKILNIEGAEVIGMHAQELLKPEIPILNTLKTGESYKLKEIKVRKDNKILHFLASGVPVVNKEGTVIGAVATIKDYKEIEEMISKVDQQQSSFSTIIHQSPKMRQVIETARMISKSTSSILLRGESGTGKELFARAIHQESNRSTGPFVIINCAALPESLLESELFGYEGGSFTGAMKGGKKGLFELADKGTLFLDEIGELSSHMQVRLLRVLQESTIRRIGSNKETKIDVRIIAATHRPLEKMVEENKFREDLYYRLNVVPLHIPPLRKRIEDIPLLVNYLVRKICKKLGKQEVYLNEDSLNYLTHHHWPGNVRQLENTLERIINVVSRPTITVQDFYNWTQLENEELAFDQRNDSLSIELNLKDTIPQLKDIVDEVERKVITEVI